MKWIDETSYSHGETERVPRVWTLRIGAMRISVHRHRSYPADVWLLSAYGPQLCQDVQLKSKDIEDAKSEALTHLQSILNGLVSLLSALNAKEGKP